jgi:putative Mg2+ transporter-C (MgtC) family protein
MSLQIGWSEIVLRLALTLVAGALIGLNRGEHDRPAGLRTTMLVCLAASISMIQMNLLLGVSGKTPSSFGVMDMMRLPLGILTGVGFIGAGSILKKGDLIRGVTTAATLWYVTVVGLCLGGGELALGMIGAVVGWLILTLLKKVENHWHRDRHGKLTLVCDESGPGCAEVRRVVESLAGRVMRWTHLQRAKAEGPRECSCEVKWKTSPDDPAPPPFVEKVLEQKGVLQVDWNLQIQT